jgi:ubiquitin carboxyl-terminal hydrolase L3
MSADPPASAPAFIPLEANPEIMTDLVHKLGLSPALSVHDVFSLTDPDVLAFVPRPALALLLVFPVSAAYESHRLAEDAIREDYKGGLGVVWAPQTIRNACGMMGLVHAVSNGPARGFIGEFSWSFSATFFSWSCSGLEYRDHRAHQS